MATETLTVQRPPIDSSDFPGASCSLFAEGHETQPYGDWRDDLVRDGVAIVKGAVPAERAAAYTDAMYQWLEDFGLGFKRDDPSTISNEHLPVINEKGMCHGYGIAHEQFAWDVRQEAGVVAAFEKVYGDTDLIVSFDAVNFAFPRRRDVPANTPWPHQDQDPLKPGFRCLQGLVNVLPNGPSDGGLIACKGAHLVSEEFHREFAGEKDKVWAWTKEWYGFTDAGMRWLERRGFRWEKICAEPGDLIVWDSRTPHYNLSPTADTPRFCIYTCYMPVKDASQEDLRRKKEAFERE